MGGGYGFPRAYFLEVWRLARGGRRIPRAMTKENNFHNRKLRRALVFFAGSRDHASIVPKLPELKALRTLRPIAVPRSLRYLLGSQLGNTTRAFSAVVSGGAKKSGRGVER